MAEIFNGEEFDFSQIYRDSAAPKDPDPSELLFGQLSSAVKASPAAAPKIGQASTPVRTSGSPGTRPIGSTGVPVGPGATRPPAAQPGTAASADTMGVLARLKPLGVTNLATLRGKPDAELRKLSGQVVNYELRQQALAKHFKALPDGSYDFTMGPDGTPTGLDATGKRIPPGQTTAAKPAAKPPTPAPAATRPAAPPAAKPAAKPAPKPAAKKVSKPAAKKPAAKKRTAAKKVTRPATKARTTSRRTTAKKTAPRTTRQIVRPGTRRIAS